jgi:hypothetical protein
VCVCVRGADNGVAAALKSLYPGDQPVFAERQSAGVIKRIRSAVLARPSRRSAKLLPVSVTSAMRNRRPVERIGWEASQEAAVQQLLRLAAGSSLQQ